MSKKTVSVIIPCYNGARFLAEAIESVLVQIYPAFEIIVVDDGSTDDTAKVAARYSGVRYIRQENQGLSAARNHGAQESHSHYLVFLDHDDRLLPDALEIGVECFDAHLECGFVFGLCRLISGDGSLLPSEKIQKANYQDHASYEMQLSGRSLVPPSTAMFRRLIFNAVGGFDLKLYRSQDYEIYLHISRLFPIYCHNQVIVEYRLHQNNMSLSTMNEFEAVLKILDNQWVHIKENRKYISAYKKGKRHWRKLFGRLLPFEVVRNLKARKFNAAAHGILLFLQHYPQGLVTFPIYLLSKLTRRFKSTQS